MNTFGEHSGFFAFTFDFVLAIAGLCLLYMLFANLDMPLIRKLYKKPQLTLRTMFFLTTVAAVDGVALNWLEVHNYRFRNLFITIELFVIVACVTGGSYVLLNLALMALQDVCELDPKNHARDKCLPKSISIQSPEPVLAEVVETPVTVPDPSNDRKPADVKSK